MLREKKLDANVYVCRPPGMRPTHEWHGPYELTNASSQVPRRPSPRRSLSSDARLPGRGNCWGETLNGKTLMSKPEISGIAPFLNAHRTHQGNGVDRAVVPAQCAQS